MKSNDKKHQQTRREFIRKSMRLGLVVSVGAVGGLMTIKASGNDMVWQLDPSKCTQCGRCADYCVLTPSAVKCVHVYEMCGYCDLCGGYFKPKVKNLTTGGENMLCPTNAITRNFIEEPYFEYHIVDELCIGCGKCVKGCGAFGNGSMQLQVRHDLCVNCNECSIARVCPSDAFTRVPANSPYLLNGYVAKKDEETGDN